MKYKLRDITKEVIDYRGKTPKKLGFNWATSGIRALSAKNIKMGQIVQPETIRFVSGKNYGKWMKQEVERGTILITSEAPFGQMLYWDSDEKIVLSQRLFAIKIKDEFNSKYVYYQMTSDDFQNELKARATGSTVTGLRQPELMKCEIDLPDLETQQKVVRILSALDEKIELNNKENDLLVEILKTNYKKFINSFEAKIKIPLQDIFNFQEGPGIRNWQYVEKDGTKFINIRCIKEDDIDLSTANMISDEEANGKYAHFMLNENDIVVSTSGTLGRSQIIRKCHLPLCLNTSIIRFWPKKPHYYSFMYCYLISNEFLHNLDIMATGSAQRNFGPMHLKQIYIYMPEGSSIDKFENANRPIIDKLCANRDNTLLLTKIRDMLLPKLMSGEIILDEVTLE